MFELVSRDHHGFIRYKLLFTEEHFAKSYAEKDYIEQISSSTMPIKPEKINWHEDSPSYFQNHESIPCLTIHSQDFGFVEYEIEELRVLK